jgi:fused signal recognition particle receptor
MFSFFRKKTPEPAVSSLEDNTPSPSDVNGSLNVTQTTLEKRDSLDKDSQSTTKLRTLWLSKLKEGLKRTGQGFKGALNLTTIDDHLYDELESALLSADTGFAATQHVLDALKEKIRQKGITDPQSVKSLLVDILTSLLKPLEKELILGEHKPTVIMVAGVNGAGKTTSIGKITRHLSNSGVSVLLAAADTFRAAAREQLLTWADRNKVEIISQESADPAAVSFDAVSAGKARGRDVVLIDTAGRLSTQTHLMEELKKIKRVIQKADETAPHEVLLVIDGNTGQNALTQVKAFDEAVALTGLVVTKLDGTAKGGVLAAIALWNTDRLKVGRKVVPVYFIGVGEKLEDLQRFNALEFAQALIGE